VPLIQVLVWASLLRGMSQHFSQLYVATGHPEYAVVDSAITGGTLILGFVTALAIAPPGQGALWVAWVWLFSYPVPLVAHYVMVRRSAPIKAGEFVRALIKPAIGIAGLTALLGLGALLRGPIGSPVLTLILLAALALGGHALYLRYVMHLRMGDILPGKAQAQ
jgi:O-antigen/teichoic acid export membrane protein